MRVAAGIEMGEGSTNELYKLDLSSHKWSQVAGTGSLPEPRSFHAMVSVKGKLYVFGGCGTSGRSERPAQLRLREWRLGATPLQ